MGSVIYDFLSESIFSHNESIKQGFRGESMKRLEKELADYRQFCIDRFSDIMVEITSNESVLKTFSSIDFVSKRFLTQTALYLEQVVLTDPLFKLTENKDSQVIAQYLGFRKSQLTKDDLARTCRYLKDIVPLVAGNFAKLFPLSYYFERPAIPIYQADHYFNGSFPPGVLEFFLKRAEVRPMEKLSSEGWAVIESASRESLQPCRAISVKLNGDDWRRGMVYFLFESQVVSTDEAARTAEIVQYLPTRPPDRGTFDTWVQQSILSVSKNYFDNVFLEARISSDLNCTYLTNNQLTADLIDLVLKPEESIQTYTTNQVINIDLPFLDKIDLDKLMDVRSNEGDVFGSFRLELEKGFRELRTLKDESQVKAKAENIFHELNDVQGQKIRRKVNHLVKQGAINGTIATAGLLASFSTGGLSLFATLIALAKGYKDYQEYNEKVAENPAYFLWKVKGKE